MAVEKEGQVVDLKSVIRIVEGFPKPGISFKDITTLLRDPLAYRTAIQQLIERFADCRPDVVVGPESRGFLIGAPIALAMQAGFVPVRKPGKLPGPTVRQEYALEYGTDCLEISADAIRPGQKVLVADDLLATGGTIAATIELVNKLGGEVIGLAFLIELSQLGGRQRLAGHRIETLVTYEV
ncbi:MAG: adenine phosphoribosyltransferase [Negativicutes bacterium]|nr:adenine phosphoribosyltransferase [Negativicutes bacterium]